MAVKLYGPRSSPPVQARSLCRSLSRPKAANAGRDFRLRCRAAGRRPLADFDRLIEDSTASLCASRPSPDRPCRTVDTWRYATNLIFIALVNQGLGTHRVLEFFQRSWNRHKRRASP
jgi:hypothetical protein